MIGANFAFAANAASSSGGCEAGCRATASPRTISATISIEAQLNAWIVHAPDTPPARNVPLTAASSAFANMSANRAAGLRSTRAVHVPEYSPDLPSTLARQLPVQPDAALAAAHAPRLTTRPCASTRVHVPVTAPVFASTVAVHVPPSISPVLLRAAQVLAREPLGAPDVCSPAFAAYAPATRSRQAASKDFILRDLSDPCRSSLFPVWSA